MQCSPPLGSFLDHVCWGPAKQNSWELTGLGGTRPVVGCAVEAAGLGRRPSVWAVAWARPIPGILGPDPGESPPLVAWGLAVDPGPCGTGPAASALWALGLAMHRSCLVSSAAWGGVPQQSGVRPSAPRDEPGAFRHCRAMARSAERPLTQRGLCETPPAWTRQASVRGQGCVCCTRPSSSPLASRQTTRPATRGTGSTSSLSSSSAPSSCLTWCWACSLGKGRVGLCAARVLRPGTAAGVCDVRDTGPGLCTQLALPDTGGRAQCPRLQPACSLCCILNSLSTIPWPWPAYLCPTLGQHPGP